MKPDDIPISRPWFDDRELKNLRAVLASGWVTQGPRVRDFEARVAAFTGLPHAVAATSCTTALHLALAALGLGPGDEVVVPAFTFVATANAVEYTGARAVFCDIDPETYNLDAALLPSRLTPRTRAVLPVHLFGLCAPMPRILKIARSLRVVEDCACALGSAIGGTPAGAFGDCGCLSFHPRKLLTTGEGGMVITKSAALAARCRSLRDHGAAPAPRGAGALPDFTALGFNYRMTDFQGAVGLAQMDKLEAVLDHRRLLANRYRAGLEAEDWLQLPALPPGYAHSYQSFVCRVRPEAFRGISRACRFRDALMEELARRGVHTRQGTHAVHALGYYRRKYRIKPEDFPQARLAERLTLALPLFYGLSPARQDRVIRALRELGRSRRLRAV